MEKPENIEFSPLSFRKTGRGNRVLISFHGYGLDHQSWAIFDHVLQDDYTILHMDLPFHGKSDDLMLDGADLLKTIDGILEKERLPAEFDLMGFSLGANYAASLIISIPQRIGIALLLAPDGFQRINFKRFLNRTAPGKWLKKAFINKHGMISLLIRLAGILGLYPQKTVDFFLESIASREKRTLLMNRWAAVDALGVTQRKLLLALKKHNKKLTIFAGKNDSVIRLSDLKRFRAKQIELIELEMGHNLMNKEMIPLIRSSLLPQSSE